MRANAVLLPHAAHQQPQQHIQVPRARHSRRVACNWHNFVAPPQSPTHIHTETRVTGSVCCTCRAATKAANCINDREISRKNNNNNNKSDLRLPPNNAATSNWPRHLTASQKHTHSHICMYVYMFKGSRNQCSQKAKSRRNRNNTTNRQQRGALRILACCCSVSDTLYIHKHTYKCMCLLLLLR